MDAAKTMDSTRLCIQINDTVVVFFQSYTYQNYIEIESQIKNMSTILGLWSNTMFRVLRFRTVNIHCKKERHSQKSDIKLVFNQLPIYSSMLFKVFCYIKTVHGCTKSPVSLLDERVQGRFIFIFIFILHIDKPVKIVHLHQL